MRGILIKIIKLYQIIPGPWHSYCKHIPTCSNYGIIAIKEYGPIKGLYLTIKRISKCNPWSKVRIDPVPERRKA